MTLIGNKTAVESFREEFAKGHLSHAFIIEGARGSGKLTLARTLSSILVCNGENPPCSACTGCKTALAGTHPDVHEILHTDLATQIKIKTIREEIIEKAYVRPGEASYQIFIIENAQMMSPDSQNALLQIFEEPPKNTVFFLLATDKNYLLKTLLSRARVIKTEVLDARTIEEYLLKKFPDKKDLIPHAVILANGAMGAAVEVLEGEAFPEMLTLAGEYLTLVSKKASVYELAGVLTPFKKHPRGELAAFCSYVVCALRDAACHAVEYQEKRIFFKDPDIPEKLCEIFGIEGILKLCDAVTSVLSKSSHVGITAAVSYMNTFFASDTK